MKRASIWLVIRGKTALESGAMEGRGQWVCLMQVGTEQTSERSGPQFDESDDVQREPGKTAKENEEPVDRKGSPPAQTTWMISIP